MPWILTLTSARKFLFKRRRNEINTLFIFIFIIIIIIIIIIIKFMMKQVAANVINRVVEAPLTEAFFASTEGKASLLL